MITLPKVSELVIPLWGIGSEEFDEWWCECWFVPGHEATGESWDAGSMMFFLIFFLQNETKYYTTFTLESIILETQCCKKKSQSSVCV